MTGCLVVPLWEPTPSIFFTTSIPRIGGSWELMIGSRHLVVVAIWWVVSDRWWGGEWCTVSDGAEDDVLAVQPGGLDGAEEELGAVGARASVGHGENAGT